MKKYLLPIAILLFSNFLYSQELNQEFFSQDIENFWEAYDKITSTKDSLLQQKYLKELYLDKATEGLKSLVLVRNYTQKEFLDYIVHSPKFWNSIKNNTLNVNKLYPEIEAAIKKLKSHYPELKPMPIYFSIGAFRTGGTTYENKVLIGSELSLADENTITEELPEWRKPFFVAYKNPIEGLALLCTHEYIHAQQKEFEDNLLSYCLYEGIAEFVSCKVTDKESTTPAIKLGKANQDEIVKQFVKDLFTGENVYNWIWGENQNHLKVRDLGYYMGYEIAERYYHKSYDKKKALKELIELDYTNEKEVERIVDGTKFLPKTLNELYFDYESQRPKIISIKPFKNGSQKVSAKISQITIEFSEPMDDCCRGFDFGNLGQNHSIQIKNIVGWSEDKKSLTIEINELKPNWNYQLTIQNFRSLNGLRQKDYLIEFKTKKR
ncbi:MAG: Ig-like domain-containing protein [Flavobacteriaceae bacterium]